MNKPLDLRLDKNEFLRWVEGREGRYEFERGRIVMMTGGSKNHWKVMSGLVAALEKRVDPDIWAVGASDLGVEIGEYIRYPDVILERLDDLGKDHTTKTPTLVAEVLSPSSLALDLHVKAGEYMSLASLECYIVASQDEPRLWIWQRARDGARDFAKEPEEIVGPDTKVTIAALAVEFPLAEMYRRLRPPAKG